jgi:GT2 family glycosyltransferase
VTFAICTPWYEHRDLWSTYREVLADAKPDEAWIVDNGSTPPLDFSTLRLEDNRGFCGGSNAGLHAATTDIVVFLNNDVKLAKPGWADALQEAVEPGVLAGARLRKDRHAHVDKREMPYLDGWCIAGMRDDLLELGGFDETLYEPAYFSDNLLCLHALAAGMTLKEVPVGLDHRPGTTAVAFPIRTAFDANRELYVTRARELMVTA